MHEKTKQVLTGVAALAAAGGITAGIAGAAKSGKRSDPRSFQQHRGFSGGGPANEAVLTGDAKARAEAAALGAVPGGKVWRSSAEDPAEGTGAMYEVHLTDGAGAPVTVLLDGEFKVVSKQADPMRGPGGPGFHGPMHGTPLTGDAADKARAAVLAALPGARVLDVSEEQRPDVAGAKYEAHVVRKDGTPAEVLLDSGFKVLQTRSGPPMGMRHDRPAQLTGETAKKARAAALGAVSGGTVRAAFAAPPMAAGAKYVVLVTRANGSPVLVLLDADFKVVRTLARPGFGGPHGHDGFGHGGPPPPGMPGAGYPGAPPQTSSS